MKQVKALYDFEAAEDNELSFLTGEVITILDDSDPNWWLQPVQQMNQMQPMQPLNNPVVEAISHPVLQSVQIDEDILLKCIQILENSDPTGEVADPSELAYYEQMSVGQADTIEKKLAEIDKQLNMLAQVDVAIRDVLAKYENNCASKN
uniref:SH3 domain-containing protein n=1 Tax=Ditylenchus dipsaci TaxID=166011 RepID=A0A915DX34_9BILA